MLAVMLGWALFYYEDLSALGGFLGRLFRPVSSAGTFALMGGYLPLMAAAVLASTPLVRDLVRKQENRAAVRWGLIAASAAGLLLCVAALASQSYNPFIYFRF